MEVKQTEAMHLILDWRERRLKTTFITFLVSVIFVVLLSVVSFVLFKPVFGCLCLLCLIPTYTTNRIINNLINIETENLLLHETLRQRDINYIWVGEEEEIENESIRNSK